MTILLAIIPRREANKCKKTSKEISRKTIQKRHRSYLPYGTPYTIVKTLLKCYIVKEGSIDRVRMP